MTTITTSSASTATAYSNQRKVDRCQNGVLWAIYAPDGTEMHARYSTDDGATWNAGGRVGGPWTPNYIPTGSLFIDVDDYAHFVYKSASTGYIHYIRGAPNAARTSYTWSAATEVTSNSSMNYPDVVAHREGTGWAAHVVTSSNDTAGSPQQGAWYARLSISAGSVSVASALARIGGSYSVAAHTWPSIDFNHTGDGKTVAGSTPHLYAAWSAGTTGSGNGIRFKKATYSTGSWTWGTEREIDSSSYAYSGGISSVFDGSRCVIVYADSAATSSIKVRERNSGDTLTSTRTPTALSDGAVEAVSVSYDGDEDIHLWAVGATSDDVKRIEYDRSAGSWDGSWTTVAAADALADTLSVKRGYSNTRIEAVYTTGTGSPYSIVYQSVTLNTAPDAATWDLTDNQAHDVAATLTLDWTFNDPDAGDTQGSYAMRRQIGSGTYAYWNAGTSTWDASEVQNTSSTTELTLAATWGADADANHKYAVKTWDAAGLAGSYSSELTVIPSAKDNPTISSPVDAGTVTAPSVTVEWSATTQTAYKARLLSSTSVELESTGWVTSTATSHTFSYTLANSTDYKVEVTTKNDEGLASTADTNSFSVSFTPPATPTLTLTTNEVGGFITVAVTNPGTGATEASNDVYVRVASGGRKDIDRPVGGDGIRIATGVAVGGAFVDHAVASGTEYQYMVRAFADTGATADSAWTGDGEAVTYYGGSYS